jgi:CRISPR-associated protein Csy3
MAKKTDGTTLKTASVLAFERKMDPSDASMHAGLWQQKDQPTEWAAIAIREKSVRGTISNRLKTKGDSDPAKLDAAIENPNLQTVDIAALPPDADTLKLQFTLRILGGTGQPNACNDLAYQQKLLQTVAGYAAGSQFSELAKRYAINLANGRFLWRNRASAEAIQVVVKQIRAGQPIASWSFDALAFSLKDFATPSTSEKDLEALAKVIQQGLQGNGFTLLEVTAFARMGAGQEIFPSQELILEKAKGAKSKVLYSVDQVASMHSQKVGNAIRTIDTWYPGEDRVGPISVEPYGSVTALGKAFRQPKAGLDFYSLLDGWVLNDNVPALEQQHYVMATLVRGGVFGESGKD